MPRTILKGALLDNAHTGSFSPRVSDSEAWQGVVGAEGGRTKDSWAKRDVGLLLGHEPFTLEKRRQSFSLK